MNICSLAKSPMFVKNFIVFLRIMAFKDRYIFYFAKK